MKARLVRHRKRRFDDGMMLELRLWEVSAPVPEVAHRLKYSPFYGDENGRVVGYDTERGKGDHRHYGEREERYRFTTAEQLLDDFVADVRALRRRS